MSHELTLIVAATRNMGIGAKGGLPWTGLKKEMAYFARVTKRLPPQAPSDARNAVIMGRKTWESIPPKFRPLKGRLNIVISRSHPAPDSASAPDLDKEPVKVGSLEQALAYLRADGVAGRLGKVFVIGGAQIYDAALRAPEAKRVLLTKVLADFECDAFFPLRLSDEEEVAEGWRKAGKSELDAWAGEEVEGGEIEENGARYEFQMWEKA
ncbi:dihydrofolate reductase [Colletotrichum tofieldiae]|uniref:Dihydrofolate reductase n=1 Tax=Colletotrichum tofieldiae TaxID=708197 RepID=A0A166SS42_9PEZI|nr:dihydrofolate reductase [Colletotrichum tofieldiae]GKT53442.1 dihydrofolate reductase [Colletotrichum tofieldiae]GKT73200.1 dihydrofolate reductase [Colletotrichum tofieldiae]GKT88140.1 dihydrofolate reductase [Colletotrichum tofieldiae]